MIRIIVDLISDNQLKCKELENAYYMDPSKNGTKQTIPQTSPFSKHQQHNKENKANKASFLYAPF